MGNSSAGDSPQDGASSPRQLSLLCCILLGQCLPAMGPNHTPLSSGEPGLVPAIPPTRSPSPPRHLPHPLLHHAAHHGAAPLPDGAEPGPVRGRGAHHCMEVLPAPERWGWGHLSFLPPQPLGPAGLWEGVRGGHGGWDTPLARPQPAPRVPGQPRAGLLPPLQLLGPVTGPGVCGMRAAP